MPKASRDTSPRTFGNKIISDETTLDFPRRPACPRYFICAMGCWLCGCNVGFQLQPVYLDIQALLDSAEYLDVPSISLDVLCVSRRPRPPINPTFRLDVLVCSILRDTHTVSVYSILDMVLFSVFYFRDIRTRVAPCNQATIYRAKTFSVKDVIGILRGLNAGLYYSNE